ncbi:MAG: VIT1/CCC1 transporter family protein [Patescibacteria group bacterium]
MILINKYLESPTYIRNIVFGVEDSLVSTVGLLSGIAVAGVSNRNIVLTGIVLIFVEGFSMGVGSLLSQHSVEQLEQKGEAEIKTSAGGAIAMFLSYFIAGFIPLLPYVFSSGQGAFWASIIASLAGLFLLGCFSAKLLKINTLRHGAKMLFFGGLAVILGVVVGSVVERYK